MSSAEGYVLPKPGIPKTLGILNIIFGVILFLYGLCTISSMLAMPAMMEFAEKAAKEAQTKVAEQKTAQMKSLDDQLAEAKTDDEKKSIEAQKATLAAEPAPPQVDMSGITAMYKNPMIMGFTLAQSGTGVLMNILLLVAGIGLIRLRPWGRKMSLWLAGLQIARLAVLTAVSIIVVQPAQAEATAKMLDGMAAQAKAPGAPPNAGQTADMAKMMAGMGSVTMVAYFVFGSIYPIVSLILLSSAGARAACLPKKPLDTPDFLS